MFSVNADPSQKLVELQITGFVKQEEAVKASNELKRAMAQFGPQEAVLLIDLAGFAPMSNDVLPILRGMGRDVIPFFRKTALVQEFAQTFQGGRKIIEPPPGMKLKSFTTREDAVEYLQHE